MTVSVLGGFRGRARRVLFVVAAAPPVLACESVKVVTPEVASVTVTPSSSTILPGATVQLTARALDPDGNTLARTASWTTANSAVATVTSSGLVTGVDAGTTTVRATVDGRLGSATITVARGPTLRLEPTSVSFAATQGSGDPPTQVVSVTNAGAGTLDGLAFTIQYLDGATGWLAALLSTTSAPAQLRLTADIDGLEPRTYQARVSVTSPVVDNGPQVVQVTLVVSEQPPVIQLSPASVGFGAIEGEGDPEPREIAVSNGGGGTLTQLRTETRYQGTATGWLETALSSTTAPATVTLQARTGELPEGVYLATVGVSAPGAANSPQDVNVTFTVGRPPPTDVAALKQGPADALVGEVISYVLTARNEGPALALDVVLSDILPMGVEFVGASNGGTVEDGVVRWPAVAILAVGASIQRSVAVRPLEDGEILNVASSTAKTEDPDPKNNDGSAPSSRVVTTVRYPELGITTGSPLPTGAVGEPYVATLTASGGDGSYTWSGTPPFGLSLSSDGVVSGPPTSSGTTSFDATVESGDGQVDTRSLQVTVLPDLAITTTSPLPDGTLGVPYSTTLTATGGNNAYTWSGSPPFGLSLSSAGVVSGTPTSTGTQSFVATVVSGSGQAAQTEAMTFEITVNFPPLTITTGSPLSTGAVGEPYVTTLTASGGDGSYTWSGAPPFGLSLSGGGVVSGTPTSSGTTSFDATVESGDGQVDTRSLQITVLPDLVITTTSPLPDGTLGVPYSTTLTATGGNGIYTWSGSPPFGLSLSSAGVVSGTPTGPAGTESFDATVVSGSGQAAQTETRTFQITVTN